jgi:hypothetical protein
MANTSKILSDSFDSDVSSEVDTRSICLSAAETKAGLVLRLTSSIHHSRLLTIVAAAPEMP